MSLCEDLPQALMCQDNLAFLKLKFINSETYTLYDNKVRANSGMKI